MRSITLKLASEKRAAQRQPVLQAPAHSAKHRPAVRRQCLDNIQAILESINHSMADVVKINAHLKNLADAEAVNGVCAGYFQGGAPACRVVGVSALPKDVLIQIDAMVSNAEGTARCALPQAWQWVGG